MKKIKNPIILMTAAFIWGVAFVAQSSGGDAIGPYSFNCIRSFIGAAVLIPVIALFDKMKLTRKKSSSTHEKRLLVKGGILCGLALVCASTVQQLGIYYGTSAGKAGFLTACYILIVPVMGLLFKRKCGVNIWIAVIMTLAGLYLLCINGSFSLQTSDILVLVSAMLFAVQIMLVDYFSPKTDGVRLACIEFFVCGIVGAFPMLFLEIIPSGLIQWTHMLLSHEALIPILYAGILSCGVAYTFQIIGQNGTNPAVASLIMSLESVFSVIAGWVLLHEYLSAKEIIGCVIIFAAIIFAQLPIKFSKPIQVINNYN